MEENLELVSGPQLGRLLVETDVPVLVLNVCRLAHREAPSVPQVVFENQAPDAVAAQGRVQIYGSLAEEVLDAGVAGVVAMRY